MGITIGPITTPNPVFLAPMSGVSDAPFRRLVDRLGAGLVVCEMIASVDLLNARPEGLRRARRGDDEGPLVVQLAGREPRWMAQGARIAENLGADIIDINMGCPARQVTTGLSGSALMRDEPLALRLIEATVAATTRPVTLKMRLGWDDGSRNAPSLAKKAENAGIRMVTVHGRTRCQFYTGKSDGLAIRAVKEAVAIPVIANGDITTPQDAADLLAASHADGVMIGRGACGRPWFPGLVANHLANATAQDGRKRPGLATRRALMHEHYDDMLSHYGREQGVRCARKHLGWYIASTLEYLGVARPDRIKNWRHRMCRETRPGAVHQLIDQLTDAAQAAGARAA